MQATAILDMIQATVSFPNPTTASISFSFREKTGAELLRIPMPIPFRLLSASHSYSSGRRSVETDGEMPIPIAPVTFGWWGFRLRQRPLPGGWEGCGRDSSE
ncbi:hypothetical protein AVEN_266348-1 [Araneus ventricosus]|uniref:Uncharacterized protein n=1 Tax=Araneus ventricosus TaxID=182803 RepID=A0A4Y2CPN6_ARAVE|nr:hypothetical protein AVEN_266348-1 [Araneus ventricosus]